MCLCMNEDLAAKQTWKGRSGKTKRGKPTGPREVVEKYRAVGLDVLELHNQKQDKAANRVVGSGLACRWCESLAERTRLRLKSEMKSRPLADAAELPLDIVEQEARQELVQLVEEERQAIDDEGWDGCALCVKRAAQKAEGTYY